MPANLTSTEVCRLLGISTKTLYLWERDGKVPKPSRDRRGWRIFSHRQLEAVRRYAGPKRGLLAEPAERPGRNEGSGLTARNQIRGTVVSILTDGLLSEVVLRLKDGQEIVAIVTRGSVRRLGIKKGQKAMAVIKATEVMLLT